jgi:hypothetical protein
MVAMAPLRVGIRRPEPPVAAGVTLVVTGLVAAVVLGNTLASPPRAVGPGTSAGTGPPTSSGVAGATPSQSVSLVPNPSSSAPSSTAGSDTVGWRPLAWAPDGRYLAVAQDINGGVDLGLLVPGVSREPVSIVRDVDERSVQWSPDGEHLIAATAGESGSPEIVLVTVTGAEALVEPLGSGAVATWSPDGGHVLLVNSERQLLAYAVPADDGPRPSLSAPTVLANDADPRCAPTWTPESLISYCRNDGTLVMLPAP